MIPPQPLYVGVDARTKRDLDAGFYADSKHVLPSVLIATNDSEIRNDLAILLNSYAINPIWVQGVEEFKANLTRGNVAACFCSFWLVGGTYRDVARHVKRQPAKIPFVLVCPPGCSQEQQDFLAALDLHAFDFMCHPYQDKDLERVLGATLQSQAGEIAEPAAANRSWDGTAFVFPRLRPSYLGPSDK